MKKGIALLLALVMAVSLLACGQTPEAEEPAPADTKPIEYEVPAQKVIHVLLPAAEEGWEAAAAAKAMAVVEELNEEGAVLTQVAYYETPEQQIAALEEIAAGSTGDGSLAVVTMPASEEMEDVFAKLVEANVAYALAETVPAAAEAASVVNVYYDQKTIGAAMAAWMVEKGLTQDSKVVILQGFSEEEALRTDGFKAYLQGKLAYDGAVIETPWTTTENIVYSEMEGETAENAEAYITAYLAESDHADTKYIAAWDDTYLLGVLDALEGEGIGTDNKAKFLAGAPFLASCGGSKAMLEVLSGTSAYTSVSSFGGIQTALYDANLLELAARRLTDSLFGQVVEQDQPQSVVWVTPETATQYEGY